MTKREPDAYYSPNACSCCGEWIMPYKFEYQPGALHLCRRPECIRKTLSPIEKDGPPAYTHPGNFRPGPTPEPERRTYAAEKTTTIRLYFPPGQDVRDPQAGDFIYDPRIKSVHIAKRIRRSRSKKPGRNFLADCITEFETPNTKIAARYVLPKDQPE